MAVEARLNVRVDTKKAQQEFEMLTSDIKDQELLVAELRTRIAEYEASLSSLSGTQRMMREGTIKNLNENLKVQRASLAEMKVKAKQYNTELKSLNKTQGRGTIKALQFNETLLKNEDITSGLSTLTGGYASEVKNLGRLFISVGKSLRVFIAGSSSGYSDVALRGSSSGSVSSTSTGETTGRIEQGSSSLDSGEYQSEETVQTEAFMDNRQAGNRQDRLSRVSSISSSLFRTGTSQFLLGRLFRFSGACPLRRVSRW